ncbi:MAG: hypothetical protein WA317_16005 [Mycobacterium sp.]|uniref:hypothetical protein n=1 Tax=Mycobacterium sp. TaxID=1785 RepID=UPI003CC60C82
MLEITVPSGQKVYIAPRHVVTVASESGFDQYADVIMAEGPNLKAKGSAKQIAEKVSDALGEMMQWQ